MGGNKISEANCGAVDVCISVEAGAAVCSMDPMKRRRRRMHFTTSIWVASKKSRTTNFMMRPFAMQGVVATRKKQQYEFILTKLCNFTKKLPGVVSLSELPGGLNQLRHMKIPLVQKLWIEKHPV